jgi:hypothetical protein
MLMLCLSLAALASGPALIAVMHPAGRGRAALDAFVLVGVAGLLLLHVLPDAVEAVGWPAGAAAVVGAALPGLLHRFFPHGNAQANRGAAIIGLLALLSHAMLDGVALGTSEPAAPLAVAVLLHRVPLSLSVWWLGQTVIGRRAAITILATEALGTILGVSLGDAALALLNVRVLPVFQALMAGTVLHVVWGHGPHVHGAEEACDDPHAAHAHDDTPPWRRHLWAAVLGAGLALAAILGLSHLE